MTNEPSTIDDARRIWNYHHVNHTLAPAEVIIVLGSHDTRVAERGAEVFLAGWAPLIVFSGNLGALTSEIWTRPEAEIFADVAFSRALLAERGIHPRRVIAVQKPYMERRTLATFQQAWPEVEALVTSPQIGFDDYPNADISRDDVIHIMLGDLQRLIVYAQRGWSAPQEMPAEVTAAFERLVAAGYTRRLLPPG
ncbi:MAG: hypothetical protein DMF77_06030 [Acidobacteria bacterium]|nr:MAG: hypothetical protein DMF77_06030 [Acidobacteriota bacterium]